MPGPAHLGIEYTAVGLRAAVLVDGRVHPMPLLMDELPWFDPNGSVARPPTGRGEAELGVSFPGFFRIIGAPETAAANHLLRDVLRAFRKVVETSFGAPIARTVIAVPTGLMSLRRSILVSSAEEAGLPDVDLVDAAVPCAIVYSSSVETPTTQFVYYLSYGECEYALLRVVRGRVKVLDSGIVDRASGQLFDIQLMEALVLALREKNIFLGLNGFRVQQWLEFRKIVAAARRALSRKPAVELVLPRSLTGDRMAIRFTVSAAGLSARIAPAIRMTLDDVELLLERNEIKPSEIDAVIALGDTAARYPAAPLLGQIFPGKVMIGDVNTVAAAAAVYSNSLATSGGRVEKDLSFYLSRYQPLADPPIAESAEAAPPPVVTDIAFEGTAPAGLSDTYLETGVEAGAAAGHGPGSVALPEMLPALGAAPATEAAMAGTKDLRELGRQLIEVGTQILQGLKPETPSQPAASRTAPPAPAEPETDLSAAEMLMQQAQDLLRRSLYAEAVNLSHRSYAEASFDAEIFAAMLRVHVDAAVALNEPEQYEEAIRILMCAHSHGRTDRLVQRAIAARHLQHARAMLPQDDKAALAAVREALRFDPKDSEALAIFDQLCGAPAARKVD